MKNFILRSAFTILIAFSLAQPAAAATLLVPGGQVIGIQLEDDTVTVTDFDATLGQAARSAGLKKGDRILSVNKTPICCAEDVRNALQSSGKTVTLSVLREGKTKKITLSPAQTDVGPRLGVFLRQGTTGLGTVTYYEPDSQNFGALGHGVNTAGGTLLKLHRGNAYRATIQSVQKGKIGDPGQLLGAVEDPEPLGSIQKNTQQGVFGKAPLDLTAQPLPVAQPAEIHTGDAVIRSTVAENTLREYSVKILKIYPNTTGKTRNLLLQVTDPALLSATGGIVQGMSGSPIIQDGRIVGAVTHVLVNDPTMGYGIFIENMLEAAG